jgi:hypothetical protein
MTQAVHPKPGETCEELLRRVIRERQAEAEAGLVAKMRALDYTPTEIAMHMAEVQAAHEAGLAEAIGDLRASGLADAAIIPAALH